MLHVVYDPADQTAWYPNFLSGFRQALAAAGVPCTFRTDLPGAPGATVFLTRYTLYNLLRGAPAQPGQVIIHEHDVWNPFTNVFDPATLWIYQHPALRVIALTNPSMAPWVERSLAPGARARAVAAGFPYDHGPVERIRRAIGPAVEKEKLVVFPGRLNEFYQPYLSFRLACEFRRRGYRAVIASPVDPQTHYPVSLWRELGVEVGRFPHDDYYRLLSRAQAAVSCTIGGSLTLALYEAHLLGATPIAPAGRDGLPPFTEMYSPRYDLLNPSQAIAMVEQGAQVEIDLTWFSGAGYVERILAALD